MAAPAGSLLPPKSPGGVGMWFFDFNHLHLSFFSLNLILAFLVLVRLLAAGIINALCPLLLFLTAPSALCLFSGF